MQKTPKKRKLTEDAVLEKARKYLKPTPTPTDSDQSQSLNKTVDIDPEFLSEDLTPAPPGVPKVKKARKTIRGPDGIKIRPVKTPSTPEPAPPPKKWPRKNKIPQPPPEEEKASETESPKKKSKKKKNKNKKKKAAAAAAAASAHEDKRHGFKALEFLKRWKNDRDDWKFEKLRQVWLLSNALNGDQVNEEDFEILLEYISSVQGRAREQTLKEMQEIMSSIEKKSKTVVVSTQSTEDSLKYERARQIVQMLSE